jgi:hypothetical protein
MLYFLGMSLIQKEIKVKHMSLESYAKFKTKGWPTASDVASIISFKFYEYLGLGDKLVSSQCSSLEGHSCLVQEMQRTIISERG